MVADLTKMISTTELKKMGLTEASAWLESNGWELEDAQDRANGTGWQTYTRGNQRVTLELDKNAHLKSVKIRAKGWKGK